MKFGRGSVVDTGPGNREGHLVKVFYMVDTQKGNIRGVMFSTFLQYARL